jgi:hypothetical protein
VKEELFVPLNTARTAYKTTRPTILLLLRVFVAAEIESLPISDMGHTHRDTQIDGKDL